MPAVGNRQWTMVLVERLLSRYWRTCLLQLIYYSRFPGHSFGVGEAIKKLSVETESLNQNQLLMRKS